MHLEYEWDSEDRKNLQVESFLHPLKFSFPVVGAPCPQVARKDVYNKIRSK